MASANTNPETEPSVDRRSADIGIVCTQTLEIRPLLKALDRTRKYVDGNAVFVGGFLDESLRIAVVQAGAGFAQHRSATQTLLAEHHPAWVLSVGFSSPLTQDLASGDVCLANEICDTHGNSLPVRCSIPESRRVLVRKHVVADHHPSSASHRVQLARSTSAACVDTTSLAVAQACSELDESGKPRARFLSVRGMATDYSTDLPEKAVNYLFEPLQEAKGKGFGSLFSRIKPDAELKPWKKTAEESATNLNRFVLSLIRQLAAKL